jgi:hypothetical protein
MNNETQPGTSVLPSACLAKRIRKTNDDHETAIALFFSCAQALNSYVLFKAGEIPL